MTGREYGGFWRRFFAFLIDEVILYFISLALFLAVLLALGLKGDTLDRFLSSFGNPARGMGLFTLLYLALSLIAAMIYFTGFHGIAGRTPGKMALGLRVIQASGDPMTPGIAFLRWVGYLLSGPPFGLGFLWVAFDGRKQGWHDKLAVTLVIRERNGYDPADTSRPPPTSAAGIPSSAEPESAPVPLLERPPEKGCTEEMSKAPDGL